MNYKEYISGKYFRDKNTFIKESSENIIKILPDRNKYKDRIGILLSCIFKYVRTWPYESLKIIQGMTSDQLNFHFRFENGETETIGIDLKQLLSVSNGNPIVFYFNGENMEFKKINRIISVKYSSDRIAYDLYSSYFCSLVDKTYSPVSVEIAANALFILNFPGFPKENISDIYSETDGTIKIWIKIDPLDETYDYKMPADNSFEIGICGKTMFYFYQKNKKITLSESPILINDSNIHELIENITEFLK